MSLPTPEAPILAPDTTLESQLRHDIERLRSEFRETPALYREVCALMFFRYGIAPTANKLYQLVHKGSMSAPAQALSKFWEELRTKTRLRIEHPDLPDELRTVAGDVIATLWGKAQVLAHDSLDAYRTETQAAMTLLRNDLDQANEARDVALTQTTHLRTALETLQATKESLQQTLTAEEAAHHETRRYLADSQAQTTALQAALQEARTAFAGELEKLRSTTELAEQRYESLERRSLLEIDQERTQRTKVEKELERVRTAAAESRERDRNEEAARSRELADLRQQLGKGEGERESALLQLKQLQTELALTRTTLAQSQSEAASLHGENTQLRERIAERVSVKSSAKSSRKRVGRG